MKYIRRIVLMITAAVMAAVTAVGASAQEIMSVGEVMRELGAANIRTVAAPRANYASGDYDKTIYVKLSCSTSGARIFYTTDGSQPTYYSDIYSEPIRVRDGDGTVTIRAFAVKTGYEDSETVEFTYYVDEPEPLAVIYMEIYRVPDKTSYRKGDTLSLSGGKISVTYEDGTYKNIDMTQSMVSGFNSNTAGDKIVTVSYEGFTDTFTIKVREGFDVNTTGGSSATQQPTTPPAETEAEEDEDDPRPQISGSSKTGWNVIEKELSERSAGSSVTILLNGAVTVPDTVIRAAAKNDLRLTFSVSEGYKWYVNTAEINKETIIPYMGLGIRVSAMYIPNYVLSEVRGTEAARFHINSDNKLGAQLVLNVGTANKGKFAALYRYDSAANKIEFIDNARISSSGEVKLTTGISGDYLVFTDAATSLIGDLDNNLIVNALDAAQLMRTLVYGTLPEDEKWDVNSDGAINARDAAEILRRAVL